MSSRDETDLRVLLVEDSPSDEKLLRRELQRLGRPVKVERVQDPQGMREALARGGWDIILSDWSMPGFGGLQALQLVREHGLDVPFIIVSGTVGEEVAVDAVRAGASDYVLKDRLVRLRPAIDRELRERDLRAAKRLAEDAARRFEDRYQVLFRSCPLPLWVHDAETLRFLLVNDAAVRHYGYSAAEFATLTLDDIQLRMEEAGTGEGMTERWHRKKDGSIITVEVKAHDLALDARRAVFMLANDVTQRIRLEEQLRQSQKMEAIGRLAGGVAHDFNNVLTVILSNADLLLAELNPHEPMYEDITEIQLAAQRAADLTRQLLMFSRQQVLERKVIDLNQVLARMDRMLQRILGADMQLLSLPVEPLGRVRVDPGSIEQVILNLVVNARDAMPRGGKLTIETGNAVLDEQYARDHHGVAPGPYVMVAVTDTGSGIDKATLSRIFEPFFTTKEAGKGTGLGLSTVFGIVQQSGGSIWVYSELGIGTTFKVYLPRVDDRVDAVPGSAPRSNLRGSETILLVEDDDAVRAVARGILERSGYQVIEARDGAEALLRAENHAGRIDLLLSDVVIPHMSGPELARRLATARPELRLLCMSGYTDDTVIRHGVLEGEVAFLQKPITPDTLTRKVREVLDSTGARGPLR